MWRTIRSLGVVDLLKIGIGPSSSHTVGPMIAAVRFANRLEKSELLPMGALVRIELYGSLGATGRGHGTDVAVLLGLCGHLPDVVDPDAVPGIIAGIRERGRLSLLDRFPIDFTEKRDLSFNRGVLPRHSNGMRFLACDQAGTVLMKKEYYSIGGGFVMRSEEHTSELQSLMRISYAFFCLNKKTYLHQQITSTK